MLNKLRKKKATKVTRVIKWRNRIAWIRNFRMKRKVKRKIKWIKRWCTLKYILLIDSSSYPIMNNSEVRGKVLDYFKDDTQYIVNTHYSNSLQIKRVA